MGKPLTCRVGWHKWSIRFAEDGGRYRECTRCQKVDDRTKPPPGTGFAAGS